MSGHQRPSLRFAAGVPGSLLSTPAWPPNYGSTFFLSLFSLSLRLETRRWGGQEVYRPYLYPCMVPIKREPLTAFVSDTVAVPVEEEGEEGR